MEKRRKQKRDTLLRVKEGSIIMDFLLEKLAGKSKNNIKSLLSYNQVKVNERVVTKYNHQLTEGDQVVINWNKDRDTSKIKGITILFEDKDIIVVEKESGLLSMSTGKKSDRTAYSILKDHVKNENSRNKVFIVHRLDRETSGVMIFAKTALAQQLFQSEWKTYVLNRTYNALVEGRVKTKEGVITSWLKENRAFVVYSSPKNNGGKKAISYYKVLKQNSRNSLVEVSLETGRKNQIRVHMQDLGHSIVGDKKYGASTNPIKRIGLHARTIEFKHPITGKVMKFTSEVPNSFKRTVK